MEFCDKQIYDKIINEIENKNKNNFTYVLVDSAIKNTLNSISKKEKIKTDVLANQLYIEIENLKDLKNEYEMGFGLIALFLSIVSIFVVIIEENFKYLLNYIENSMKELVPFSNRVIGFLCDGLLCVIAVAILLMFRKIYCISHKNKKKNYYKNYVLQILKNKYNIM